MIIAGSQIETEYQTDPVFPDCYQQPTTELLNDLYSINNETNPKGDLELNVASVFWQQINLARIENNLTDPSQTRLVQIGTDSSMSGSFKEKYKGLYTLVSFGSLGIVEASRQALTEARTYIIPLEKIPDQVSTVNEAYAQYRLRVLSANLLLQLIDEKSIEAITVPLTLASRYATEALSIAASQLLLSQAESLAKLNATIAELEGKHHLANALTQQAERFKILHRKDPQPTGVRRIQVALLNFSNNTLF
ncbi:MAG: hypothetical protein QG570_208 [Patescibacteria group bacterium]|nr:hypothetical protein [Patescibacteria group bacterium]